MKKIKYILSAVILSIFLMGCEAEQQKQDSAAIGDESIKPIVSYSVSASGTVAEISEDVIVVDITMDKPILTSTTFRAEQIGGTAVLHEDYEASTAVIEAYQTTGQLVISITKDLDVEGAETLDLQIGANAVPDTYEVIGNTTISLTIEDWVFCGWTLETTDTYGDGWNGGYVALTTEGVTTEYAAEGSGTTFEIGITDGEDYSFEYVSGGGGFCGGPGYECENYFKLTAPDGTVWEEGSQDYSASPTEGIIVAGTNVCP